MEKGEGCNGEVAQVWHVEEGEGENEGGYCVLRTGLRERAKWWWWVGGKKGESRSRLIA